LATAEEINAVMTLISRCHPATLIKTLDSTRSGMGLILRELHLASGAVSIGDLSEKMAVSPPRITALVRKLEERGIALRCRDPEDSRRVLVELTEKGRVLTKAMEAEAQRAIGTLIDRIGLERLQTYFEISQEIKAALEEKCTHFPLAERLKEEYPTDD